MKLKLEQIVYLLNEAKKASLLSDEERRKEYGTKGLFLLISEAEDKAAQLIRDLEGK